ncbi:MAG TPA: heavy metal transporter [Firmicutes bacterium]|nr:heavy metal transporter [Bacillota bacterium]
MKMVFILNGLDCANCANNLENIINKVEGINSCTINFMTNKLFLDIENEEILEKIIKICNNFEDGVYLKRIA